MSLVSFGSLPDDARLWCFGSSRALETAESERLRGSMRSFVAEWTAHRRDLHAGFEWLYDRFLLVGVDESRAGASGCSIDALTRHLQALGTELEADFLDSQPVWFRDDAGNVRSVSRAEFAEAARRGRVSSETTVFDLTLSRCGDLRSGRLETEAANAWHRSLLISE